MSFLGKLFRNRIPIELCNISDWHSHILPGVDDGIKTMDDALSVLAVMERTGFKNVWLTPHIMEDIPNTVTDLQARFRELQSLYDGGIHLQLAAENMIDGLFSERLNSGHLLPIGENADMLLVETSYFNAPANIEGILTDIWKAGYKPLIAHPERYVYMDEISGYGKWKEMGCLFQLNLLSLGGHYGTRAKKNALKLLAEGMYDYAGTDIHRLSHLTLLTDMKVPVNVARQVERILAQGNF